MALLYRNQYLDKKDSGLISTFKKEYGMARSLYYIYKRKGLKVNLSNVDEFDLPASRTRQILFARMWDKSSIYNEPRDCSYFTNRAIMNRIIKEYLHTIQVYSSMAGILIDSLGASKGISEDATGILSLYAQILTGQSGCLGYTDAQYTEVYNPNDENSFETDMTINIGSLGPFNAKDEFGIIRYPFIDASSSYYHGWKLSKIEDDSPFYKPYKEYGMNGKTIIVDKVQLDIELCYFAPTVTFYPSKTNQDPIITGTSDYIHYLCNARKKYVVKLKTPLRLINPFYGGYIKEWFRYYDDDDDN